MGREKIESEIFRPFPFLSHAFLTRHFGADQAAGILECHSRPRSGSGAGSSGNLNICRLKQVHSNRVIVIPNEAVIPNSVRDLSVYKKEEADAMVTRQEGIALTIVTADCVPLLFCDPRKKIIAAAHAGWRGTSKKIASAAVQRMIEEGANAKDIYVAVGPSVQKCCYEVDHKVYDAICHSERQRHEEPLYGHLFKPVIGKREHWTVSLSEINREQLIEAGVPRGHIWLSSDCTACLETQYYSYRREGKSAGRQWSYIALK